jgi:hypothetical protein
VNYVNEAGVIVVKKGNCFCTFTMVLKNQYICIKIISTLLNSLLSGTNYIITEMANANQNHNKG